MAAREQATALLEEYENNYLAWQLPSTTFDRLYDEIAELTTLSVTFREGESDAETFMRLYQKDDLTFEELNKVANRLTRADWQMFYDKIKKRMDEERKQLEAEAQDAWEKDVTSKVERISAVGNSEEAVSLIVALEQDPRRIGLR